MSKPEINTGRITYLIPEGISVVGKRPGVGKTSSKINLKPLEVLTKEGLPGLSGPNRDGALLSKKDRAILLEKLDHD